MVGINCNIFLVILISNTYNTIQYNTIQLSKRKKLKHTNIMIVSIASARFLTPEEK